MKLRHHGDNGSRQSGSPDHSALPPLSDESRKNIVGNAFQKKLKDVGRDKQERFYESVSQRLTGMDHQTRNDMLENVEAVLDGDYHRFSADDWKTIAGKQHQRYRAIAYTTSNHVFNNIMASVTGMSQLLGRDFPEGDEIGKRLGAVGEAGDEVIGRLREKSAESSAVNTLSLKKEVEDLTKKNHIDLKGRPLEDRVDAVLTHLTNGDRFYSPDNVSAAVEEPGREGFNEAVWEILPPMGTATRKFVDNLREIPGLVAERPDADKLQESLLKKLEDPSFNVSAMHIPLLKLQVASTMTPIPLTPYTDTGEMVDLAKVPAKRQV